MDIVEKLQVIAENEQKIYDAGYAKGKSEGGGGGASDPAAEAVMALIRMPQCTIMYGDANSIPLGATLVFKTASVNDHATAQSIIIPETVETIDSGAFDYFVFRDGKYNLLLLGKNPPIMTSPSPYMKYDYPPEAIYVPDTSVDAYKTATNWSEFAHLIKPMSYLIPTEITFSIEYYSCTALLGMTWDEWISSNYFEEFGIMVSPDGIVDFRDGHLYKSSDMNTVIKATDEIQSGAVYTRAW